METIKNYLENMFSHLPNTPEVQKAKYELYQMMEDKYNELISEGKSDNEAIGIVISEFGNLDELADSLGIKSLRGIPVRQCLPPKHSPARLLPHSSGIRTKQAYLTVVWSAALHNRKSWTDIQRMHSAFTRFTGRI